MKSLLDKFRTRFTDVKAAGGLTPDNFPEVEQMQSHAYLGLRGVPTSVSAYFACIRNISDDIGKLPRFVYEKDGDVRNRLPDSRVQALINDPMSGSIDALVFWSFIMWNAVSYGNGYAAIFRDGANRPTGMLPLPADRVTSYMYDTGEKTHLAYKVTPRQGTEGEPEWIHEDDMLHVKGPGNAWVGFSLATLAANNVSIAQGMQGFANNAIQNAESPGGVLTHPQKLSKEAAARLRESWNARHGGSANANRLAVLEEGMTYAPINMPIKDVQYIESSKFQVEEICRWFRMPPHKVQDLSKATWGNVESLNQEYVPDCLMPWVTRLEQQIKTKLIYTANREVKLELKALLRGDQKTRAEYYNKMFMVGSLSPNDIRGLEDLAPVPGGDEYFVPANMVPLTSPIRDMTNNVVERFVRKETLALGKYVEAGYEKVPEFYERHIDQMEQDLMPVAKAFRSPNLRRKLEELYVPAKCFEQGVASIQSRADELINHLFNQSS